MRLNNRGWGLGVFLGFVCFLLFFIIIVGVNSYKLGISKDNNLQFDSSITDNNSNSNNKDLENKVLNAAMNYKRDKYSDMSSGQVVIVKISNLVELNYLSNSDNCSGYVEIKNKDNDISYAVYLKCPNYVTEGYNSDLEK